MPLSLPPPDKRQLARSPLALVVCQVKFEARPAVVDARLAVAFHDSLGGHNGRYDKLEPVAAQALSIQGGPMGIQSSTQSLPGWRIRSSDGGWTIVLMPDHVALETSRYTTWSGDFEPRLHSVLDATVRHIEPALEQRLGLRYVDRITEPPVETAAEWREYINPTFLGPALDELLGEGVRAAQQQIDLDLGQATTASIRHGFFADPTREGKPTYLLDVDVYRESGLLFDPVGIKATLKQLHERSSQIFQRVITPTMLQYLDSAQ
jgi:uncharacterized protein (TIGR04255 family)